MNSGRATSQSEKAKHKRAAMWHHGLSYMGEKQIQAYLIARVVLRQFQRTSACVVAPPNPVPNLREASNADSR